MDIREISQCCIRITVYGLKKHGKEAYERIGAEYHGIKVSEAFGEHLERCPEDIDIPAQLKAAHEELGG